MHSSSVTSVSAVAASSSDGHASAETQTLAERGTEGGTHGVMHGLIQLAVRIDLPHASKRTRLPQVAIEVPARSCLAEVLDDIIDAVGAPELSISWQARTPLGQPVDAGMPLGELGLVSGDCIVLMPHNGAQGTILKDAAESLVDVASVPAPSPLGVPTLVAACLAAAALLSGGARRVASAVADSDVAVTSTASALLAGGCLLFALVTWLLSVRATQKDRQHYAPAMVLAGATVAYAAAAAWVMVGGYTTFSEAASCSFGAGGLVPCRAPESTVGYSVIAACAATCGASILVVVAHPPALSAVRLGPFVSDHQRQAERSIARRIVMWVAAASSAASVGLLSSWAWFLPHASVTSVAAVCEAVSLVMLVILAHVSIRFAGLKLPTLPGPGTDIEHCEDIQPDADEHAERATAIHSGAIAGVCAVAIWGCVRIGLDSAGGFPQALVVCVGAAIGLHSVRHSDRLSQWLLWCWATSTIVASALVAAHSPQSLSLWAWVPPILMCFGALTHTRWAGVLDRLSPTTIAWLERLETLALVACIPLALHLAGVFEMLRSM